MQLVTKVQQGALALYATGTKCRQKLYEALKSVVLCTNHAPDFMNVVICLFQRGSHDDNLQVLSILYCVNFFMFSYFVDIFSLV